MSQVDTFRVSTNLFNTVDGSEIRRSPVEVGSLSHYLQGFIHPKSRKFPNTGDYLEINHRTLIGN